MESNIVHKMLLSIAQSFRLPTICALCNQFHTGSTAVCDFCIQLMAPLGPSCQHCAYPLFHSQYALCGACIKKPPPIDRAYIPYRYQEPLRGLLHEFKYHKGLYLASSLCNLMYQALPLITGTPQCLIPVPLHAEKLKQRGFNHTVVLTKLLAKKVQLPFDLKSCVKIKNTVPQASLSGDKRRNNLTKAFEVKPLPYDHVILIDDLLTTGSTANALALTLKRSGVQRVDVWCCARTVYA